MEQIYYTQCPVGYGLGASNGFQIKRMSAGYPVSGDFRHFGLRAFPGGGRTLAPPVLRYRRDGEVAEIAWLTPRPQEYETERGFWGRPGGVFAHGLRVALDDLAPIRHWPAGLFDGPQWRRADREPTRGRPPDEFPIEAGALASPPDFAAVADRAAGLGLDPDRLARLLASVAAVAREGRTLFLIDNPARLGPVIALLTFAFPEALRADLTFSTYHDRPEELPGFRIQGTATVARPNKLALASLGVVADLAAGTFDPRVEAPRWARTLAAWFLGRGAIDEADWSATDARSSTARRSGPPEACWADDWLDHLVGFPAAYRSRDVPADGPAWVELGSFATWSGRAGLGDEWLRPRGPSWWLEVSLDDRRSPEARSALVEHLALRDAWRGEAMPAAWGDVVALWFREVEGAERDEAVGGILRNVPRTARPSFARSLLRGLTTDGASAVLRQLRADPATDRATLLPLEAGAEVAALLQGGRAGPLARIVTDALALPGATSAILEAAEAGLVDRPDALPLVASELVAAFDLDGSSGNAEGLAWALRHGKGASGWLGPALRPLLADAGGASAWLGLRDRTPEPLRPALARAFLGVAGDPGLPDEPFRWGVEALLMPLAPRPNDPSWAGTYLARIGSDWDLIRRLSSSDSHKLGVPAWLDQARTRGELSAEQAARIDNCRSYVRSLKSGDPRSLLAVDMPGVPPEERGKLLAQMLDHVGGATLEGLPLVLDACREAWPGAFRAGAPGLRALAWPLARRLAGLRLPPEGWVDRLVPIVDRLGLKGNDGEGFEPEGLASEVVAAAAGVDADQPWPRRQLLLDDDARWRALAADARRELAAGPAEGAADVVDRWDNKLSQGKPERFFALMLNACDGERLAGVVSARALDLKTLPPLPWWRHDRHPGAIDDLRDAYARTVPLAPLPVGGLSKVRAWIGQGWMSDPGLARWRCLEGITNFQHAGADASARWPVVVAWEADLPLDQIDADDRHRFVAWVVAGLDEAEPFQVARLAKWLFRSGLEDPDRLNRWADEPVGLAEVPHQTRLLRADLVGDLRAELITLRNEARGKRPRVPGR